MGSSPTLGENFLCSKKQYFANPIDGELKSKLKKPFQFFYILYNKKQFNQKFPKKDDHYQTQSLGYHRTARLTQSLEHGILNPRVVGSSPTLGEKFLWYLKNNLLRIHLTECLNAIEKKTLSIPLYFFQQKKQFNKNFGKRVIISKHSLLINIIQPH